MPHVAVATAVRLFVQEFGSGAPVVFVAGGGMTHAAWDHQTAALMDRFRTIAYDFRGTGASDRPPEGYSVDSFAGDLLGLLDRLELERPAVVAYALGSHVALRAAATRPDVFGRLALVSSAPWFVGDRDGEGGFSADLLETMSSGLARNRAQADLDLVDGSYFHRPPGEGMRQWCFRMALTWPLPVLTEILRSVETIDHRETLPEIRTPVLVVHGRHDRKNRTEGGVYLAEHIPGAELVVFEESAHCPMLEEVERFNEVIAAFYGDGPRPGLKATSVSRRG